MREGYSKPVEQLPHTEHSRLWIQRRAFIGRVLLTIHYNLYTTYRFCITRLRSDEHQFTCPWHEVGVGYSFGSLSFYLFFVQQEHQVFFLPLSNSSLKRSISNPFSSFSFLKKYEYE